LLAEQETKLETIKKMYSLKKVVFDTIVTTTVPNSILQYGGSIQIDDNIYLKITPEIMNYLTNITEQQATYVSATTVTITAAAATNPITSGTATKNEFDVYINGQYADKITYTWTPTTSATQTIVFNTAELGFDILSTDVIIVKGRWA
jgi:hypothetical protein